MEINIPEELNGERLDIVLYRLVEQIPSRSFAAKLIQNGFVTYQNKKVKPSFVVEAKTSIGLDLSPLEVLTKPPLPESLELNILFEDDDVLVINKSSGMVVHPGAGNYSGTLVNAILNHCGQTLPSLGGPERAGIVHRLDKETSGVMVVAKSQQALSILASDFATHAHEREYVALVYGTPTWQKKSLITCFGRHPTNRIKYAVLSEGKNASTDFEVLKSFNNRCVSLIRCNLYTGRTHQIRVHLSHLGHGLLGDSLYGQIPDAILKQKEFAAKLKPLCTRQMLHARLLSFNHPRSKQRLSFVTEPPEDFENIVTFLTEDTA